MTSSFDRARCIARSTRYTRLPAPCAQRPRSIGSGVHAIREHRRRTRAFAGVRLAPTRRANERQYDSFSHTAVETILRARSLRRRAAAQTKKIEIQTGPKS